VDQIIAASAAAGSFLAAGFYFAFAVTVMPGLARDARTGASVMREVNRWAVRPPFMVLFFGTAILCALVCAMGLATGRLLGVVGGAAYLAGVVSTALGNVRLNDALDRGNDDADAGWAAFAGPWSRLNIFRTVASAAGGILLLAHVLR
jgi:uncharacterized membrane protein